MKKLFIPLFLCLFLFSCASKPAPRPAINNNRPPIIEIIYKDSGSVLVTFMYTGKDWLFIRGVEVMNGAGDTKRCMIDNPHRNVTGGRVGESGVFSVAFTDEFKAWLGDSVQTRVICDYPQEFAPVKIKRE